MALLSQECEFFCFAPAAALPAAAWPDACFMKRPFASRGWLLALEAFALSCAVPAPVVAPLFVFEAAPAAGWSEDFFVKRPFASRGWVLALEALSCAGAC